MWPPAGCRVTAGLNHRPASARDSAVLITNTTRGQPADPGQSIQSPGSFLAVNYTIVKF